MVFGEVFIRLEVGKGLDFCPVEPAFLKGNIYIRRVEDFFNGIADHRVSYYAILI